MPAPGRRLEVLRALQRAAEPLTIAQVATKLGVHQNTVRFHLDGLRSSGRVETVAVSHSRQGRPALHYRAVRRMDPEGTRRYEVLAEILTHSVAAEPNAGERAAAAGRAWGRQLVASPAGRRTTASAAPVARLVAVLDDLGFAPERRRSYGATQVGLRQCPFLELAQGSAAVVCSIHLGIMQGALQAWGADQTVDRLEPFVEPDLCVASLAPVARPS